MNLTLILEVMTVAAMSEQTKLLAGVLVSILLLLLGGFGWVLRSSIIMVLNNRKDVRDNKSQIELNVVKDQYRDDSVNSIKAEVEQINCEMKIIKSDVTEIKSNQGSMQETIKEQHRKTNSVIRQMAEKIGVNVIVN